MRSGTENTPSIVGLAEAVKAGLKEQETAKQNVLAVKKVLAEGILGEIPYTHINGPSIEEASPYVLNVSFNGLRSEVLLHSLEEKEIYVSAGSACSSHKRKAAGTLSAMGMEAAQRESTLRFSFSEENTFEEVDYALEVIGQVLPILRRYSRH